MKQIEEGLVWWKFAKGTICVVKPERALKARVHNIVIATSQEQASRLENDKERYKVDAGDWWIDYPG